MQQPVAHFFVCSLEGYLFEIYGLEDFSLSQALNTSILTAKLQYYGLELNQQCILGQVLMNFDNH
jgi:hypothetical protein